LALVNTHYTYYQSLGLPIVKTLLSPQCMRRLNSYLAGSHAELILVTLNLLNGISAFGGGRERKAVMDGLVWESKVLRHVNIDRVI
jgi:nucleolar pre-ribosomal-associated protein 1